MTAAVFHHVGITVDDIESATEFWSAFLEVEPMWVAQRIDGSHIPVVTGHADAAVIVTRMPFSNADGILELIEFDPPAAASASPSGEALALCGRMHVNFQVPSVDAAWQRAVGLGARPVSESPVSVPHGPNAGARSAYLAAPGGGMFELTELQPSA